MHRLRQRRRPIAWIAMLALVAAALMPALSHAFGGRAAEVWAEICTSQGMKRVLLADAAAGSAADAAAPAGGSGMAMTTGALDHCPFCSLQGAGAVLPPAEPAVLPQPLESDAVPERFLHAPRTLFAWRTAQPRGPPAFS